MKLFGLVPLLLFPLLFSCSGTPPGAEDFGALFENVFEGDEVAEIEISVEASPDTCSGWGNDRDKYLCVVSENMPGLSGTYRTYKESNPDVTGGMAVELEIAENGSVERAELHDLHFELTSNVLRDSKLISILLEELKGLQFVQLSKRSTFTLLLPFSEFSVKNSINSDLL